MTSVDVPKRRAAEYWFLDRGLPAVLRPGALVRRLWSRSAPALAALAVWSTWSVVIVLITGKHTIDIDGEPTRTEWFVLVLLVLVIPATVLGGWLVSRIGTIGRRAMASTASVVIAFVTGLFGGPTPKVLVDELFIAANVALILVLTASGVGSILGWAGKVAVGNLRLVGALFVRALPFVLLTVLVFFNTYVWLMAEYVSRGRLWLALLFMGALAVAFVTSSTVEQVRPMLTASAQPSTDDGQLVGTPFADIPDPASHDKLSRTERLNVMFVLAVSQVLQVGMVAIVTGAIFLVLGLILLSPRLLAEWTRNGATDGQFLGMTLPVPGSLIQTSMFLAALTFMYVSARAVSDGDYRSQFLDPLIADLRLTLVARNRYRTLPAR